jgi:hypothetical protein
MLHVIVTSSDGVIVSGYIPFESLQEFATEMNQRDRHIFMPIKSVTDGSVQVVNMATAFSIVERA